MIYANVGPDGVIVFEPHADPSLGRLPIGHATNKDAKRFKATVSVNARHAYDGVTLLVPRIPEARSESEALDALLYFRRLIEMRMNGEKGWPRSLPVSSSPDFTPADPRGRQQRDQWRETMKRTKYLVTNGNHSARFSAYADAMFFAREASRWDGPIGGTHLVEVRDTSGIVAQFSDGDLTPEFAHVDPSLRAA